MGEARSQRSLPHIRRSTLWSLVHYLGNTNCRYIDKNSNRSSTGRPPQQLAQENKRSTKSLLSGCRDSYWSSREAPFVVFHKTCEGLEATTLLWTCSCQANGFAKRGRGRPYRLGQGRAGPFVLECCKDVPRSLIETQTFQTLHASREINLAKRRFSSSLPLTVGLEPNV